MLPPSHHTQACHPPSALTQAKELHPLACLTGRRVAYRGAVASAIYLPSVEVHLSQASRVKRLTSTRLARIKVGVTSWTPQELE